MSELLNSIIAFISPSHILTIVYIFNFLIALGLIFVNHKRPTVTLAWIMILFMVPVLGLILYLVFSQNLAKMKINRMSTYNEELFNEYLENQKLKIEEDAFLSDQTTINKWKTLIFQNYSTANGPLTKNENIELIVDGNQMFERLCSDIREAEDTINLSYFIIKNDEVGTTLLKLLEEKARQGVKVRLLMDALGSKSIGKRQLRGLRDAGAEVALFFKPVIRHLYLRINFRNHRKLVTIDNRLGYIGGFNIGREYLGRKKKFGYWRDTQLIIQGDAVAAINKQFLFDWCYTTRENIDVIKESSENFGQFDDAEIPVQIVSSGPNSIKEDIKHSMMRMIVDAKESVYIQTPYLVPDEAMLSSIAMAAIAGVDVRIMIPCMPDHPFVYKTTLYNAGLLLQSGAKVYIYDNGFLHAKTLVVDGEVSTVGSCNFDIRSFRLNFESNAFVYDTDFGKRMMEQFEEDMRKSHEYTLEDRKNLSLYEKLAESVSRLLTEIL